MRIVVFGAGGMIGIPTCEYLADAGHEVVAIDRFYFQKKPSGCVIHRADIRTFDPILLDFADVVIDLAGLSNDASSEIDPELTKLINVVGGCRLAEWAKAVGVKRYIYSSSCSVYGQGAREGLTEDDPVNPITAYARAKIAVENCLRALAGPSFEVVILRNATVFGVAPRMRFDLAVNVMTMRAWRDGVIYIMGGGQQWRPFIHVSDVVSALVSALTMPAGTYNIGFDRLNHRISDVAAMVRRRIKAVIHRIPDDPDERSYHVSFAKAAPFLSKRPVTIDKGISEVIEALVSGTVSGDDPTTNTLGWYSSLIQWEKTLRELELEGRIL